MNIGIDIDDTITNSSEVFIKYARIYNKEHGIKHEINTSELDQNKAFGWTPENMRDFTFKYLKTILTEVIPNKDVIKTIKDIKKMGCKIYLITARKESEVSQMYILTKQWLIKNNIKFDKLIINCTDKLKECLKNNIMLFIDDNYLTCKKIHDSNKIRVLLYETNYNKKYIHSKLERVKNWKEILLRVCEMIDNDKIIDELEYIDVDNREDFPIEPEGYRYIYFYGGTKYYRGYLAPANLSRADFMERYPQYIPEQNTPVYENKGIILRADPKFPCPGFYILSLNKTYKAFDLIDDITFLRFSFILKKVKEGMRKKLGINYAHLLSNEKSDSYVNVHFWLVPINGTTSPDLLDFDVKKYLNSFNPKEELEKIIFYNNTLKRYFKQIDLIGQDNLLTETLINSRQFERN